MDGKLKIIIWCMLLSSSLFVFNACRDKEAPSTTNEQVSEISSDIPSDFFSFYENYQRDTSFQMSRIIFPLPGKSETEKWKKENWDYHTIFNDMGGTFNREFRNWNDIIFEYIFDDKAIFTLERRYAKLSGDWHLIFYNTETVLSQNFDKVDSSAVQ